MVNPDPVKKNSNSNGKDKVVDIDDPHNIPYLIDPFNHDSHPNFPLNPSTDCVEPRFQPEYPDIHCPSTLFPQDLDFSAFLNEDLDSNVFDNPTPRSAPPSRLEDQISAAEPRNIFPTWSTRSSGDMLRNFKFSQVVNTVPEPDWLRNVSLSLSETTSTKVSALDDEPFTRKNHVLHSLLINPASIQFDEPYKHLPELSHDETQTDNQNQEGTSKDLLRSLSNNEELELFDFEKIKFLNTVSQLQLGSTTFLDAENDQLGLALHNLTGDQIQAFSPAETLIKTQESNTLLVDIEQGKSVKKQESSSSLQTQVSESQKLKKKYTNHPETAKYKKPEFFCSNFFLEDGDEVALNLIITCKKNLMASKSKLYRFKKNYLTMYEKYINDINPQVKFFEGPLGKPIRLEDKMSRLKLAFFLKLHKIFHLNNTEGSQEAVDIIDLVEEIIVHVSTSLRISLHDIPGAPKTFAEEEDHTTSSESDIGPKEGRQKRPKKVKTHTWRGKPWKLQNRLTTTVQQIIHEFLGLNAPITYVIIARYAYYIAQVKKREHIKSR